MNKITRREFMRAGAASVAALGALPYLTGCSSAIKSNGAKSPADRVSFVHATDTHLDLGKETTVKWVEMLVDRINRDHKSIDFVLFGGDNFNNNVPGMADAQRFKKIVDELHCPYHMVRGNKESTPTPPSDSLDQKDFAGMFFGNELQVQGRDWKLNKGDYTFLGIDSTLEQHNNGLISRESLDFVENELKKNPERRHILLHHHVYDNFWKSSDEKDIHKYVLNNVNEVKSRLFKHANLLMTLSGHKHLNSVTRENGVTKIATCGFVVPQDPNNLDDHRMRHIEIANGVITEKVVSIV